MSASEFPDVPFALEPPCAIDGGTELVQLWSGRADLIQGPSARPGIAELHLDLRPRPIIRFTFKLDDDCEEANRRRRLREMFEGRNLQDGILKCGPVLQDVLVNPLRHRDGMISGTASPGNYAPGQLFDRASFLVSNGPMNWGDVIAAGNSSFMGRQLYKGEGFNVTVDRVSPSPIDERRGFEFTHVAQVQFADAQPGDNVDAVADTLFHCLSFIRGGWVAIAGPWLYLGEKLTALRPDVTKASRQASLSWCPKTDHEAFAELFGHLHAAKKDEARREALHTAIHWLTESLQCAGGIEGSIVLLQAALESLAWFEIVQSRKICSTAGFEKLIAADKIRWLLSLYRIPVAIPSHCEGLDEYLEDSAELNDLPAVLTDVRNSLIHGSPKKVLKHLQKENGNQRRAHLWYLVVGVLEQAILAVSGYQGKIQRRDLDERFTHMAVRRVPWSAK